MSGSSYNNHPYQPPDQNGASSSGFYQHPQESQQPMHSPQGYHGNYGLGSQNSQNQYNQPPPPILNNTGMQAVSLVYPPPALVPIQPVVTEENDVMGYRIGPVLLPAEVVMSIMHMTTPHQPPPSANSQQNMSIGQLDQMDTIHGEDSDKDSDGSFRFSERIYQEELTKFPLGRKIVEENDELRNLLSGMTRDMVQMKKQLIVMEGRLESLSLPKTDQSTQTQHFKKECSNGHSPVQAPGSLDLTDRENINKDLADGETQTIEIKRDEAPKSFEAAPHVQQITTESNKLDGNTDIPKEFASEESAVRKMITEHASTVEIAKVTRSDDVTPTAPPKHGNFTKAQYAHVVQTAAASSHPITYSTVHNYTNTTATAPPLRTAKDMPAKRAGALAPPKPVTSKPVSQAVEKPTGGFVFPKPRKTAPATPTASPNRGNLWKAESPDAPRTSASHVLTSAATKAATPEEKSAKKTSGMSSNTLAAPKQIALKSLSHEVEKPTEEFNTPEELEAERVPSVMTNDKLKTAFAQGRAVESPPLVHLMREVAPPLTPSKTKNRMMKAGSAKKSPAVKAQEQENYDFVQIQHHLDEFEKLMKERLTQYSSVMSQAREFGKPKTEESYHLFYDQIATYLRQQTKVDLMGWSSISRNLTRRIATYAYKTDLESLKIRSLLRFLESSTDEIFLFDSMYLFGKPAAKKKQESIEESYLKMIMEFDSWKPDDLVTASSMEKASFQENMLNWICEAEDAISQYSAMINKSRAWHAAFVKGDSALHPVQDVINSFLRTAVYQSKRDISDEELAKRISMYGSQDTMNARKLSNFYKILSLKRKTCILNDVAFLFSEYREERTQCILDIFYMAMVINVESWLPENGPNTQLVRNHFVDFPVQLPNVYLDGFIGHINSQFKLRYKLENWQSEYNEMQPLELKVYDAHKIALAQGSVPAGQNKAFLLERKEKLKRLKPQTKESELFLSLFGFLCHVDSSIIDFDLYHFKKCVEEPSTVDPNNAITSDKEFLVQTFRMAN